MAATSSPDVPAAGSTHRFIASKISCGGKKRQSDSVTCATPLMSSHLRSSGKPELVTLTAISVLPCLTLDFAQYWPILSLFLSWDSWLAISECSRVFELAWFPPLAELFERGFLARPFAWLLRRTGWRTAVSFSAHLVWGRKYRNSSQ